MRRPAYLSPTSVAMWTKSPEEFYLKYLADNPPPRFPQTEPMSVGAAFDAHVKSYLYDKFYGKDDPKFEFTTIFEAQVEPHNRDFALVAGQYCFDCYKKYGAIADLMLELGLASSAPRMEFSVEGRVTHESNIDGLVLSGKPDIYFKTNTGAQAIFDWKVNGYCSNSSTSPAKGYVRLRGDPTMRGLNQSHKDAMPIMVNGLVINGAHYLEQINDEWAAQLAIYSWLMGTAVGDEAIVGIDQLVFSNPGHKCRIAAHRCRVSATFQRKLFAELCWIRSVIDSGHIFRDLSLEESQAKQAMLDNQYLAFQGDSKNDKWFTDTMRQHRDY